MLFYKPEFALFFAILLLVLTALRTESTRKIILLLASYFFYMWWNPIYVLPLLATTVIDYQVGKMIGAENRERRRRLFLSISIVANLGLLAYFKYYNFFAANAFAVAKTIGLDVSPATAQVILPIGISFYTFHSMSYTIDVYRNEIPVCRSPLHFALFVTFFPVLIAGPILRARQFLPQLNRKIHLQFNASILLLIIRGFAKKVLVADNIGPFADAVFADPGKWPSIMVWMATLAFSVQIYCDFSGYSDIARGLAAVFGYEIPLNFNRPYFAQNPSEFWRRWHISLSSWLRDYLYIPLGGNRGSPLHTYRNLMLTMLLGGLWHGASWNFVLWGFLHGMMLSVHRALSRSTPSQFSLLSWAAMQYCILVSWIAFRLTDTAKMIVAMKKFVLFDFNFTMTNIGLGQMSVAFTAAVLLTFWILHLESWRHGDLDQRIARLPLPASAAVCVLMGALFVWFWPLVEKPFIYFQF